MRAVSEDRQQGLLDVGRHWLPSAGLDLTSPLCFGGFEVRSSTQEGIQLPDLARRIADDGFAAVRNVVPAGTLKQLRTAIEAAFHMMSRSCARCCFTHHHR